MKKRKIGVVGLGGRGHGMVVDELLRRDDIEICAVCDSYEDRTERTARVIGEKTGKVPRRYCDYREFLKDEEISAVFIFTSWNTHIAIAIAAMERGIPTAMEVGCAYSVEECWQLVHTQERTQTPFMMLENCCYYRDELFATNLVRKGVLGTIVHCEGAYGHDLRNEVSDGEKNRHYRLKNYLHRNCENYPTHELGPIAKILNINRGNRILSLYAISSKSCGLKEFIREKRPEMYNDELHFNQGDVVTTLIKCANGETIRLKLDTTLPRKYSRELLVCGTKGRYSQELQSVFMDGDAHGSRTPLKDYAENTEKYAEYMPKLWKEMTAEQTQVVHGGMDAICVNAFLTALNNGEEMPIDVYDAATWLSIGALTEQSLATNSVVYMPDFTNGRWIERTSKDVIEL